MAVILFQIDILIHDFRLGASVGFDQEILHIAGMWAIRILQAMLFVIRIEMGSCGLEVGRLALGVLMNMYGVLAGRKMLEIETDFDSGASTSYRSFPNAPALGVFEFDLLACRPQRESCKQEPRSDA